MLLSSLAMNVRERKCKGERAHVVVLLAAFNGRPWIAEQVESILDQVGVDVSLIVSDDMSDDGTWEWLQDLAGRDARLTLLPREKIGGAAKNFYRLLQQSDISTADYIALADQDDIWEPEKLSRHAGILKNSRCLGVSSNVRAFWEDNRTSLLKKNDEQRSFDFLFEAPGPGCSFLMKPELIFLMRNVLDDPTLGAMHVGLHDWLIYAVCRASGNSWHIDDFPSLRYRQHSSNEFGANVGWRAKFARLDRMRGGWYRDEVRKIARVSSWLSSDRCYEELFTILDGPENLANRLRLLPYGWRGRRRSSHRLILVASILIGVF